MKYIPAEKLIAEIERRIEEYNIQSLRGAELSDLLSFITSLQQEQPDTCVFGNIPSESSCKFCGIECALREPKQTGTTSAGFSSKDEAVGLAIMAHLDTKVKHDNAKVCGVSLKVAREWIREKIAKANKQEHPGVDLEKEVKSYIKDNFTITDEVAQIPEEDRRYSMWEDDMVAFARHFWNKWFNARKEE